MVVKRKKCNTNQKHKDKSVRHDHVPQIENTSPFDCISLPDIVLNIDETERFESSSDDEIQLIDQVNNESNTVSRPYVLSPIYRLNATSNFSTEPVTPLLSPGSTAGRCLSPEVSKFRVNPLSSVRWSDSDSN